MFHTLKKQPTLQFPAELHSQQTVGLFPSEHGRPAFLLSPPSPEVWGCGLQLDTSPLSRGSVEASVKWGGGEDEGRNTEALRGQEGQALNSLAFSLDPT